MNADTQTNRCVRRNCEDNAENELILEPDNLHSLAQLCEDHYQEAINDSSIDVEVLD